MTFDELDAKVALGARQSLHEVKKNKARMLLAAPYAQVAMLDHLGFSVYCNIDDVIHGCRRWAYIQRKWREENNKRYSFRKLMILLMCELIARYHRSHGHTIWPDDTRRNEFWMKAIVS